MKHGKVLTNFMIKEPETDLNNNQAFILNVKASLLLALLEKEKVTQWQYDRAIELLREADGR